MDNKVIEVLDYLGEKFGIAVDWTSENVWPQVTEFMGRYATYEIVRAIVWIAICMMLIATAVIFLKIIWKSYRNKGFWYYNDFGMCWVIAGCVFALVFCIPGVFDNIFKIVEWTIVPEMKFVEVISGLLKSSS